MRLGSQLFDRLLSCAEDRQARKCRQGTYDATHVSQFHGDFHEAYYQAHNDVDFRKNCTEADQGALKHMCFTDGASLSLEFTLLETKTRVKKFKKKIIDTKENDDAQQMEATWGSHRLQSEERKNANCHACGSPIRSANGRMKKQGRVSKRASDSTSGDIWKKRSERRSLLKRGLLVDGIIEIDTAKHRATAQNAKSERRKQKGMSEKLHELDRNLFKLGPAIYIPSAEGKDRRKRTATGGVSTSAKNLKLNSSERKRRRTKSKALATRRQSIAKSSTPKKSTQIASIQRIEASNAKHPVRKHNQTSKSALHAFESLKDERIYNLPFGHLACNDTSTVSSAILEDRTIDAGERLMVHGDYTGLVLEPYLCLKCPARVASHGQLLAHLTTQHNYKSREILIMDSSLKCPVRRCRASLSTRSSLNAHIKAAHHQVQEVKDTHLCQHCSAQFPSRKALRMHMAALYRMTMLANGKRMVGTVDR